ncbi:MAG: thiamine pyrophosphate-dependent enzyme [Desulfovermiculus sp.]
MHNQEQAVFTVPEVMVDTPMHFCPGCHHGTIHRLVGECLTELGLVDTTICVGSVGCSVFIYNYLRLDAVEAPHGRAAAVATGVKRARPENFVFTYQGDGDLAAIGLSEIVYAANRGEKMSVVFVNNTVYGMTGGQMAPTTMVGQKTTTCAGGRSQERDGAPLKMAEMLASLQGTSFSARVAVDSIAHLKKAKKALKKAFEVQIQGLGLGFVEFLSACPTNWHMNPLEANARISGELSPYFPLGVYKDSGQEMEASGGETCIRM